MLKKVSYTYENGEKIPNRFLLYVRCSPVFSGTDSFMFVYDYTGDVFHAMGEIIFRIEYHVERIDYVRYSDKSVEYCLEKGLEVRPWFNKYE